MLGAVFEKSYLGSVSAMQLNSLYAAVLFDGKIQLHAVSIHHKVLLDECNWLGKVPCSG